MGESADVEEIEFSLTQGPAYMVSGTPARQARKICTFDYSVRVMNNHAGLTLTRPTGTTFSHCCFNIVVIIIISPFLIG